MEFLLIHFFVLFQRYLIVQCIVGIVKGSFHISFGLGCVALCPVLFTLPIVLSSLADQHLHLFLLQFLIENELCGPAVL